jgi:CRISPR/Cas system-associated endonuclease Cas3-HD
MEANDKLRKVDNIRDNLKIVYDRFEEVGNSFDDAIENADYQLIVDSVKKDFDNAFDGFYDVKKAIDALDI